MESSHSQTVPHLSRGSDRPKKVGYEPRYVGPDGFDQFVADLSSEPFYLPPDVIQSLTWHDARKRYIEPQLERQKKYQDNAAESEKSDPQKELEQALAMGAAWANGKATYTEIQEAFLKSYGKPYPEDIAQRLEARMKKKEQERTNVPFRNKPGEPIRTQLDEGEMLREDNR